QRRDEPGRRLVLPRPEGCRRGDQGLRRVLARRRGRAVGTTAERRASLPAAPPRLDRRVPGTLERSARGGLDMRRHFAAFLLSVLASGCATERSWVYKANAYGAPPARNTQKVVVLPFQDARNNVNSNMVLMYLIP